MSSVGPWRLPWKDTGNRGPGTPGQVVGSPQDKKGRGVFWCHSGRVSTQLSLSHAQKPPGHTAGVCESHQTGHVCFSEPVTCTLKTGAHRPDRCVQWLQPQPAPKDCPDLISLQEYFYVSQLWFDARLVEAQAEATNRCLSLTHRCLSPSPLPSSSSSSPFHSI